AEDGIRDKLVTGVQTCALPIFGAITFVVAESGRRYDNADLVLAEQLAARAAMAADNARLFSERSYVARKLQESLLPRRLPDVPRSEERRVGKEGRCRWARQNER